MRALDRLNVLLWLIYGNGFANFQLQFREQRKDLILKQSDTRMADGASKLTTSEYFSPKISLYQHLKICS